MTELRPLQASTISASIPDTPKNQQKITSHAIPDAFTYGNISSQSGVSEKRPATSPEEIAALSPHQKLIYKTSSFILSLLPKRLFSWIEKQTLYPLAGLAKNQFPIATLGHLKQSFPNNPEIQNVEEGRFSSGNGIPNRAWHFSAQPRKPTVLLSGGNLWTLNTIEKYRYLMEKGVGVLLYEYPGYGGTTGEPSKKTACDSLKAAIHYLNTEKT
jgi:hypothetical protein